MVEKDGEIKPIKKVSGRVIVAPVNIVGEKVDHLAHGGLAQGRVGELQGFSGFF